MIQRFCFAKLRDPHAATRGDFVEALRAELAAAGADAVVGLPADASAKKWDLSIVITAASLSAWHALAAQPQMVGVLDQLAERAEVIKAWTFESPTDETRD